jgi:hypothetical protein
MNGASLCEVRYEKACGPIGRVKKKKKKKNGTEVLVLLALAEPGV